MSAGAGDPGPALRHVTIADLRAILAELEDFWGPGRDMAFLHQALYVHEFGETSVLAERDGEIDGYLLGFVGPDGTGYIHAVAVRRSAQGHGLARAMYERFEELVRARDAYRLKAITAPENEASRSFHEALGFAVEEVACYSPGAGGTAAAGGGRLVFTRPLGEAPAGAGAEVELDGGVRMRPMRLEDVDELHRTIEQNREHIGRWLPFSEQPYEQTAAHVRRTVRALQSGSGLGMVLLDGGRLVGAVSFVNASREHRSTQIGYWLAQAAQGRGTMTRAVSAMVEEAFGPWGFRRVEIRVAADNARSRAIPERLGFRREGVLRSAHTVAGESQDEVVYGLLAEDERKG